MNLGAEWGDAPFAGRYYKVRYLSEGNFGAVFHAKHYAFGEVLREVAVKIGKKSMKTNAEGRRTFPDGLRMAEVQEKAKPHLRQRFVTVYDAGICESGVLKEHPFVVMELLHGSLKDELRPGKFTLPRANATFDQILEAMECMHTLGFVHRDLKPGNILVTRAGNSADPDEIKVTDFGLAQKVDSVLGWTDSAGDLAHLAPEAFDHDIASPQTDVYMLGLIFYEMVTGSNPFAGVGGGAEGAELRERHRRARKRENFELLEGVAGLSPELKTVILRALAYDTRPRPGVTPRYFDAGDFRTDWERAKSCGRSSPLLGRVKLLLAEGKNDEAEALARAEWSNKKCKSTLLAMAECFEARGNKPQASHYRTNAENCSDQS